MSEWDTWGRFSAPKKPPPAHGVRMTKAGTSWWGERWIGALVEVLRGDAGRLARGRSYARAGRAHDFVIEAGQVKAKVTGSRPEPYEVSIALVPLSDEVWRAAIAGMAGKAQFSAALLGGELPRELDEVFRAAGASLFPLRRAELTVRCSCPDWGDPCKHAAATHYVLGEALDRDPFLLLELRGRTKEAVLSALREARGGDGARGRAGTDPQPTTPAPATVQLEALSAAAYDRAPEALPALSFCFEPPSSPGAVLRQLGTPAGWSGKDAPGEALAPVVRAAAERARSLALTLAEPSPQPSHAEPVAAAEPKRPRAAKRAARTHAVKRKPR